MQHYILIQITAYKGDPKNESDAFLGFERKTERIELPNEKSRKLGDYSWLIHRDTGAKLFAEVVTAAELQHLKYDVWYLSSD